MCNPCLMKPGSLAISEQTIYLLSGYLRLKGRGVLIHQYSKTFDGEDGLSKLSNHVRCGESPPRLGELQLLAAFPVTCPTKYSL